MASIVRRFGVTSSPRAPSPRVAPRTKTPFSYVRLTARPSIFGSRTYAIGSSSPSRRLRTSSAHLVSPSSVVPLSSEPSGTRWSTFWNLSDGGAPTRRVGESGGISDAGTSRSSSTSSSYSRSYSASAISGSSRTWYAYEWCFRSSRSSSARFCVLEDAKQILRRLDECVGVLDAMDPAPADGHGVDARRTRGSNVERRISDVRRLLRPRVEQLERLQDGFGIRLVAVRVVRA